ncbi:hypothetical protein BT93_E1604 [Corymbia citriodora subsp. variegata]|nr:hypothetical protein BT93_E1604 [Corymbia citriodora subsp. variegata]
MEHPEQGFSNGLYLAKLAVSSDILKDSWKVISKYQGKNPEIITDRHEDYKIIAFVSSPVSTSDLRQDSILVSRSGTLTLSSYAPIPINLQDIDGSIASLFTLWHLNKPDPTKYKLFCITFGLALLGDTAFQQAISCHRAWNSCFLHVVHKDDCVPRLFLAPPITGQSSYKPFGTFLLCSESGCVCFQAPESVIELLTYKGPRMDSEDQESCDFDYKDVIKCLQEITFPRESSSSLGHGADSYKAGITAQITAVGLWQSQRQREEFDYATELNDMKVYMALLEWYIEKCRAIGQGPGYYDSFKNARERRDNGVDKYKTYLTDYWEKVVEDAAKKPQIPGAKLRCRLLFAGKNYQKIVEPLDMAEYYRRGRKDYLTRGRSNHYRLLQQWLEDSKRSKMPGERGRSHGMDAIRSCRLLDRAKAGSSDGSEGEKPFDFDKYVMDLIEEEKVSSDIFLDKSSYMQWWREYVEISEKVQGGSDSHPSRLVDYMKKGHYKYYVKVP